MRLQFQELEVAATATTGTEINVSSYADKWVQIIVGATGATIVLEGSIYIDGDETPTYVAVSSSVTADGIVEVPQALRTLRTNRTVAGAGTVTARFVGRVASP